MSFQTKISDLNDFIQLWQVFGFPLFEYNVTA